LICAAAFQAVRLFPTRAADELQSIDPQKDSLQAITAVAGVLQEAIAVSTVFC
jgi:hypothetical protein